MIRDPGNVFFHWELDGKRSREQKDKLGLDGFVNRRWLMRVTNLTRGSEHDVAVHPHSGNWYLRVEHGRAEREPRVVAYSATADEYAKQHGRAVLEYLAAILDLDNGGMINTGDYEIVQANKNALSVAFMTIGPGALGMTAADPALLQREAYALYQGIARYQGLKNRLADSINLKVADVRFGTPLKGAVAALDGVLQLSSDSRGEITFHGLRPREYRLHLAAEGYDPAQMMISSAAVDTLQVQLAPKF